MKANRIRKRNEYHCILPAAASQRRGKSIFAENGGPQGKRGVQLPQLSKVQKAILAGKKDELKVTDLPGIGPRIGKYLNDIGIYRVGDLKGQSAEELYTRNNIMRGFEDDPCFIYVFRMAIYFAENDVHDPEKLKWWTWRREGEGGPRKKRGAAGKSLPPLGEEAEKS